MSHLLLVKVRLYNKDISHEHKYHDIKRCETKKLEFLREIEKNGNPSKQQQQKLKTNKQKTWKILLIEFIET